MLYKKVLQFTSVALVFFGLGVGVGYTMLHDVESREMAAWKLAHQDTVLRARPVHTPAQDTPPPVKSVSPVQPKPATPAAPPVTVPDTRIPPVEDGLAPVVTNLPTKEPVVFLGIDDGAHKTPDELQTMKDNHIKATLFLSRLFIDENPGFFKDFVTAGNVIENHTLDHHTTMSTTMTYEQQKAQICGMADYEEQQYGRRPILFRPPGGAYSTTMRRAAADCGMKAVVTWIAKANGGSMQYQIGDHLRPGDVVLMHFRPEFQADMAAFLAAMKQQNLHTELLEDWLPTQ